MSPCCWMAVYIEQSRENVNDAGDRCRVHIGMPNYVGQQGAGSATKTAHPPSTAELAATKTKTKYEC